MSSTEEVGLVGGGGAGGARAGGGVGRGSWAGWRGGGGTEGVRGWYWMGEAGRQVRGEVLEVGVREGAGGVSDGRR